MKTRNLVAKHSPYRADTHKDRKRASRQVRGHKHKESDMARRDEAPDLSLSEIIEELSDMGYSTEALSNEELINLYISVMDGHKDEAEEELDFSDD